MISRPPRLKWHKLRRKRSDPPFLRENLHAGLRSRAPLEVDLVVTADRDFVCLHDLTLDRETTGSGPVRAATRSEIEALRLRGENEVALGQPPLFLDEIVAAVALLPSPPAGAIQLDMKEPSAHIDDAMLGRFRAILGRHVKAFVASGTDAALVERIRAAIPDLPSGFDPLDLYEDGMPSAAADFEALAATTLRLAPDVGIYYLEAELVLAGLRAGVNLIERVSHDIVEVDAWTIDADRPRLRDDLRTLIDAGAHQITTNDPDALGAIIEEMS